MTISFAARATIPDDVLMQELEGESVFLDIQRGQYFGLDEVGTRMWKALTTAPSIQAAYETLLAEYDVDEELLQRDLGDLLEKLVKHGLLEVRDD